MRRNRDATESERGGKEREERARENGRETRDGGKRRTERVKREKEGRD